MTGDETYLGGVKRMCDLSGCLRWGVAHVMLERNGKPSSAGVLCQEHLDYVVDHARSINAEVTDERKR